MDVDSWWFWPQFWQDCSEHIEAGADAQRVTVIMMTFDQSIGSHKGSFLCQMSSESLKIPDMSKTSLEDRHNMAKE